MSAAGSPKPVPMTKPGRAHQARRDLLDRITHFFEKHDLNVTGPNLSAIGTALSGANAELAETFVSREISGELVDQRWLDTVTRLDPEIGARMHELEKLMDKMELSLMRFAQTAKSAKDKTSEHRGALDAHIQAIASKSRDVTLRGEVKRVIDLSTAMLERITQVEEAMQRSQAETDELRNDLAKARVEADVDHLTRLPNRRAFERQLVSMTEEAQKAGVPLCVAFCDIDHFKLVNDTHGHEAGDRVLVAIASILNSKADDRHFIARQGGEEFVLLFYGLDKDEAWRELDAVRRAQAKRCLINRETGKPFGKITFSGGIAEVLGPDDTREALARADAALYRAKSEGRNRIATS